jgi:hypothetical protein
MWYDMVVSRPIETGISIGKRAPVKKPAASTTDDDTLVLLPG